MSAIPTKTGSLLAGLKRILVGITLAIVSVAGLAIVAFAGLWGLGKAGTVDTYYRCPGTMEMPLGSGELENSTAFLRLQTYRPFLFWAKDDGMLWVETTPQDDLLLLQKMTLDNDEFFNFNDGDTSVAMSKNSLVLRMTLPRKRYFTGECARTNR